MYNLVAKSFGQKSMLMKRTGITSSDDLRRMYFSDWDEISGRQDVCDYCPICTGSFCINHRHGSVFRVYARPLRRHFSARAYYIHAILIQTQ